MIFHPSTRYFPKRQGILGNFGIMRFVFTNFQADNYGSSSGDDDEKRMYNCIVFSAVKILILCRNYVGLSRKDKNFRDYYIFSD